MRDPELERFLFGALGFLLTALFGALVHISYIERGWSAWTIASLIFFIILIGCFAVIWSVMDWGVANER